jgi:hypothetical protein
MLGQFSAAAIAAGLPRSSHWIDQQQAQSYQKQLDSSRRQLEQQQQLNQERFRAEHGWQLHPRPQPPWEERRREDALRKEFPPAQSPADNNGQ